MNPAIIYYREMDSPLGVLTLRSDGRALTGVYLAGGRSGPVTREGWVREDDAVLPEARRQLTAYFAGERLTFDLPMAPAGTAFQCRVWQALSQIPHAETISYGELARRVANPKAVRAVGLANGRNPLAIIVPCHRVIGANGALVGFGGGLDRKRWLLAHEQTHAPRRAPERLNVRELLSFT